MVDGGWVQPASQRLKLGGKCDLNFFNSEAPVYQYAPLKFRLSTTGKALRSTDPGIGEEGDGVVTLDYPTKAM